MTFSWDTLARLEKDLVLNPVSKVRIPLIVA